jgi:class 3 adenylate cyclase
MASCRQCSAPLPEGARFCPICATPVKREPATRERKLATVLFADLVGSTALGGSLDPEQTRDMLDRFYDAMAAEIALGGGTVEKFIGDAVVAVFGAPAAQEDHAERALQVALWMQARLAELFGGRLALRIGVNTGEVVVGRPREGSSFVTGDAVNVAARLEQAATAGKVLAGERTVALVGEAFEFEGPTTIEAKGKPEGVPCRRLVRMVGPQRPRGGRGLATAFVGRERELARLEDALAESSGSGRPLLVTLVGEPGVGKTSVVREFGERIPEGIRFRLGRCLSYGRSVTYSPFADVLRAELGLRQEDPPETVMARLEGREILGLMLGLDIGTDLDPRAAGLRLRQAWVRFMGELVAEGPVVLAIEDLHWAAEPLLDLLALTLAEVQGPVLVLAITRPGGPTLRIGGESVALEPLTDEEAAEMLDRVLDAPLDEPARGLVIRHADGNPFFLEEVLSELIDRRLLERRNGAWALRGERDGLGIPDSVQGVLAARIDLLDPSAKAALQAAAVIGRSLSVPALSALVGSAAEIRTLVERGFLRPTEPELVFKHALTREVAYGTLPRASRAHLHAAFASWLEREEGQDAQAGTLAYHYAEAANPEIAELAWRDRPDELERLTSRALHWLGRAAELALGRFDLDENLALLHRAAEVTPSDVRLWQAIGRANALKFDGEAYWQAMLKATELTSERDVLAELYGELAFESTMRGAMWKRAPDDETVLGWMGEALELAAPDSRAFAYASIAKGMREDDVPATERAISIAKRMDDVELLSFGLDTLFAIAQNATDYASASTWARQRLALADRLTDPDHLAQIHWTSSTAELALGHLEEAETHARRHDAIAARLSPHHAIHAVGNLLTIEEAAGRWDGVRNMQDRTELAVGENAGTPCIYNARCLLSCAAACGELGLDVEARRLEEAAAAQGFEGYGLWLDPLRARLALTRGDLEALAPLVEGSEKWLWVTWNHVFGAATRLEALVALGRLDQAAEDATRLVQPDTYLEPFALRTLALARQDEDLLARAVERFEALGLLWQASRTWAVSGPQVPAPATTAKTRP